MLEAESAIAMLEYCGCLPSNLTTIEATLQKDSQAGTSVSQEAVKKNPTVNQHFDLDELNRHLQNHPYIKTSDNEVPNTLKV
jgi:hypothetical protein